MCFSRLNVCLSRKGGPVAGALPKVDLNDNRRGSNVSPSTLYNLRACRPASETQRSCKDKKRRTDSPAFGLVTIIHKTCMHTRVQPCRTRPSLTWSSPHMLSPYYVTERTTALVVSVTLLPQRRDHPIQPELVSTRRHSSTNTAARSSSRAASQHPPAQ